MFCREDGTALDHWQVRREFAVITTAAGLGETWAPRELRHSFMSILSAHGVRTQDISDLVGHSGTTVTGSAYRHGIRPAHHRHHGHEQDPQQGAGQNGLARRERLSPSRNDTRKHQPGWLPARLPKIKKGSRMKIRNPF